jgi:hypothetical protein
MLPLRCFLTFVLLALLPLQAGAQLPLFDFTQAEIRSQWEPTHDVRIDTSQASGLVALITGPDPYLAGPPRDFPTNQPLWMELQLHSDAGGPAQLFWFGDQGSAEERSIRFHVPAQSNFVVRLPLPPLGPATRLRIDPPGFQGECRLISIRFTPRPILAAANWREALIPALPRASGELRVGTLRFRHSPTGPGAFALDIDGLPFAIGHRHAPIGYLLDGRTHWFNWGEPVAPGPELRRVGRSIILKSRHRDPDGAIWTFTHLFSANPDHIGFQSSLVIDQDRDIIFVPALILLPGVNSFGTDKQQGLLAGVEYLANEESSSERDLTGPQARRQVPDPIKLTFPLMAIAASNHWLSLAWNPHPDLAALHDSPDRLSHSGGHLFALIHPGADPAVREDGSLLPHGGHRLRAGEILRAEAFLQGGPGQTVVPAVQAFVQRTGLPPLPTPIPNATDFFQLSARGWLDSAIHDGAKFRHAIGSGFNSQTAADAGFHMRWLASRVAEPVLAERLAKAADNNEAQVPDNDWLTAQIGHLKSPSPALLALKGPVSAARAKTLARQALDPLGPDTRISYTAPAQGTDLGRTHWEHHANGLTAQQLVTALDHALFSGETALVEECLVHLRRLSAHDHEVPRGAQTWEIPLHTPDILASAHLVHLFVRGYELTGDPEFLERARYWAWTGIPFVYLSPVGPGPVHVYSTTPVLGATQFIAPNWIGLPVQWCGLVYAEALLQLARHDTSLDWRQVALGIGLAGVQHVHPESDTAALGCLPDSFDLRAQARNPVPINPATLSPIAAIAYGELPLHGFAAARLAGAWILAAGPATILNDSTNGFTARLQLPTERPGHVLLGGLPASTTCLWEGEPVTPVSTHPVIIELQGTGTLELQR